MITPDEKPPVRPSWDVYFMEMARSASRRSTCPRAPGGGIGCVITAGRRVLSTGYVGSLRGQPHCTEVGCLIDPATGGCMRTVHAEQNAVLFASREELSMATAYSTLSPCWTCFRLLVQAGVTRIVFAQEYRLGVALQAETAHACGVRFEHLDESGLLVPLGSRVSPTP